MNYQFRVKKSERGKRLESFLYERLGNWSHKKIKQALDHKRAFVNKKNIFIATWNLKPNDLVEFIPHPSDYPKPFELSRYHHVDILFEDNHLLITNKPSFLDYDTFVSHVNAYLKRSQEKRGQKKYYPYLGQMHRLDKETSGILVFTKKKEANILADQFRTRQVKKYYLALVEGQIEKEHDVIKARLQKGKFEGGKKVQIVGDNEEGKESVTEYWVQERYADATLLKILIGTGRTHQIRVHLSDIGHPIIGDKLYGKGVDPSKLPAGRRGSSFADRGSQIVNRKNDLRMANGDLRSAIKRQALHAHRLELIHPMTKNKMKFEAPIPSDFLKLLDTLREGA